MTGGEGAAVVDVAAGVLADHELVSHIDLRTWTETAPPIFTSKCSCGWEGNDHRTHVAEALAAALAPVVEGAAAVERVRALVDQWEWPHQSYALRNEAVPALREALSGGWRPTCPTCGLLSEVPGDGRYCGDCEDHEGHCANNHCMTCGGDT